MKLAHNVCEIGCKIVKKSKIGQGGVNGYYRSRQI